MESLGVNLKNPNQEWSGKTRRRGPETVGEEVQKGDFYRCLLLDEMQYKDRFRQQTAVADDTVRDVAFQTAKRGGKDAKLFAKIQDVRCESG
jgi:hypothetical protein